MTRTVGLIIFPGFQALDLAVGTVFELANDALGEAVYAIEMLSETGGLTPSSFGAGVDSRPFRAPGFDTVIMTGGLGDRPGTPGLIAFLKEATAASRRTASICTGAFFLAEAGLLDGRRATTHWARARDLQRRYPKVKVEEDRIFIEDRGVWTSAGMTACIDLALALVAADVGEALARTIAKRLVVYHLRAGGQSQFSAMLDLKPASDRIQTALAFARENIALDLSVERLAEVARLSPRQFSRAFRSETGQSPAKAVETLRVEAARQMLEAGRLSNEAIAQEAGFVDPDRMRRAFLRAYGQPPQALRRAARSLPVPA
ncbi:GlxA family transcriptional regulator [Methylopila sp. Yamaguchi]|uniref:GlxA family transcriptional regulator n=1 Tax=Methylopila sp. Yamaguchi TaxID=1437817 RepID=UPI000CBA82A7|nr:GlxA family transcriptional regulator [Methylopila sp. Yamaguchi]GBD48360.1 AraC family transcriptional regulator [Methylopila sp. Yamaguchi]